MAQVSYASDPGGVFESDAHRRVLGHLSSEEPFELQALGHRISDDRFHGIAHVDDLDEVLKDLEADGYANSTAKGWKLTKKGLDALQAPAVEDASAAPAPAPLGGLEVNGEVG
jgi:hypothetical protein